MSAPAGVPAFTGTSPGLRLLVEAAAGGVPRTAAVVGNAPLAASAERARSIDESDLVLRMTTFAVDQEVPVIGRSTHVVVLHRAVRPGPSTFESYRSRTYLLAEPGRPYGEQEALPAWWPADLAIVPIPNRSIVDPLKRSMRIADGTASWPTTGTLAVHLLHSLFPAMEILLTGTTLADPRPAEGSTFAHAWGAAAERTPEHRLAAERRMVRRWIADGFLRVVR